MEENNPRDFIPDEYKFAHDYCFFLHDLLASIVVVGEQEEIFHHKFPLKNSSHAEQMDGKIGDELASWMEQNGYAAELWKANRRHICVALLSDLCQFVYEAIDCSKKGKLTVTFALLRKPLKENLFYFEWLLADSDDFINRFHAPLPKKENAKRPIPQPMQLSKEKRIEIIGNAMKKTDLGVWISPEFIYQLRYDKDVEYGLEWLFQRANHLITTFVAQTEEQNFNFVFSGDEEKLSQWKGLYTTLPVLLLHAVLVIEGVIGTFENDKLQDFSFMKLRAIIGFLLYVQSGQWNSANFAPAFEGFLTSFSNTDIPCFGCQEIIKLDSQNIHSLYREGVLVCQQCGYKTLLTSRKELLLVGHLLQEKIICPNCHVVVLGNEENIESVMLKMKVICQNCNEELVLS
jgi:hypothetical protein